MKTTPTTTSEYTTGRCAHIYNALPVDPRSYPDHWSFADARLDYQREHLAPLWEMTVEQRIAAMRRGELTMTQLFRWASRYPEQVPTIDGEFEFVAAFTPEIAEED